MRNFTQSIDWSSYLTTNDLVCFSPISWEDAHDRQQHLMNRFAKTFRVFFIEEPALHSEEDKYIVRKSDNSGVLIVTPYLQESTNDVDLVKRKKNLVTKLFIDCKIGKFVAWYYTPLALSISSHLEPEMHVYDRINELSSFTTVSPEGIQFHEAEIFKKAKLVFTDSTHLYESKKHTHNNIFSFENTTLENTTTDIIDIFNDNLLKKDNSKQTMLRSVA